jgi:hypothetical protein
VCVTTTDGSTTIYSGSRSGSSGTAYSATVLHAGVRAVHMNTVYGNASANTVYYNACAQPHMFDIRLVATIESDQCKHGA